MSACDLDACEILEWDTAFFGFRIGRICGDQLTPQRVRQVDAWCRQQGVYCLYFLACSEDAGTTRLAEDNGFRLVDIRLTFVYDVPQAVSTDDVRSGYGVVVRPARPDDVPVLQGIARESHSDSRFHYDSHFPVHLSQSLYETWIRVSCEGYADVVLVADLDSLPLGYVACHLDEEHCTGKIGLVGVSSSVRREGIGQTLILNALDWFATQGMQEVLVATQGRNIAAQRIYQRCGFLTQTVQLWYHKWYRFPEIADD